MKRLLLVLALALATAGVAGADTFRVVASPSGAALAPNASLSLAPGLLAPPAQPEQLSVAELMPIWQAAGSAYGIPWQVLAAINEVESNFGQNMGPSSAGAIGWMQFMPDTWLRWGMDANGDGVADPWNPEDAIWSAARYLAAAGGATDIAGAVFAYNHAQWYVDQVLQLAQTFSGGPQVASDLQALQQQVDDARAAVVQASDDLATAQAAEQKLVDAENALLAKAQAATLLSDQLTLQKSAADLDGQREQAHASVEAAQVALAQAQATLTSAQQSAQAASFDPGARTLLSGASSADGYVFPVGGGPGLVSVSHTHHDYPAADIAAPEGSPVYALADAVVTGVWTGDPHCGNGLDLQTSDGRTWTYCHLAAIDPAVVRGASLSAGTQVGLVGHTGDATGPHLHLQLQPPTEYPQDEAWFQSFAGTAFTWQDEAPVAAPAQAVFAVVPEAQAEPPTPAPSPAPDATFAAPPDGGAVVYFHR